MKWGQIVVGTQAGTQIGTQIVGPKLQDSNGDPSRDPDGDPNYGTHCVCSFRSRHPSTQIWSHNLGSYVGEGRGGGGGHNPKLSGGLREADWGRGPPMSNDPFNQL